MKQAKIKGIRKYIVRTCAFILAIWRTATTPKKDLLENEMNRMLMFKLFYRYLSFDTYDTYSSKEMKARIFGKNLRGNHGK